MNEHIFCTIKLKWGYYYTNLKGLEKVNGEFTLIMTVYNLKRFINILGVEPLIEKLEKWRPSCKEITHAFSKPTVFEVDTTSVFSSTKVSSIKNCYAEMQANHFQSYFTKSNLSD